MINNPSHAATGEKRGPRPAFETGPGPSPFLCFLPLYSERSPSRSQNSLSPALSTRRQRRSSARPPPSARRATARCGSPPRPRPAPRTVSITQACIFQSMATSWTRALHFFPPRSVSHRVLPLLPVSTLAGLCQVGEGVCEAAGRQGGGRGSGGGGREEGRATGEEATACGWRLGEAQTLVGPRRPPRLSVLVVGRRTPACLLPFLANRSLLVVRRCPPLFHKNFQLWRQLRTYTRCGGPTGDKRRACRAAAALLLLTSASSVSAAGGGIFWQTHPLLVASQQIPPGCHWFLVVRKRPPRRENRYTPLVSFDFGLLRHDGCSACCPSEVLSVHEPRSFMAEAAVRPPPLNLRERASHVRKYVLMT